MLKIKVRFEFEGARIEDPFIESDVWVEPNSIQMVLPSGLSMSKVTLLTGEKLDVPENAEKLVDKIREAKKCVRN